LLQNQSIWKLTWFGNFKKHIWERLAALSLTFRPLCFSCIHWLSRWAKVNHEGNNSVLKRLRSLLEVCHHEHNSKEIQNQSHRFPASSLRREGMGKKSTMIIPWWSWSLTSHFK
jgi:hypothetical protein